ncbi:MAG: tail protein X [Culturomica sp.]|jgi:phage tail protein X|nr:tail protein X [Culturomica sp.]
MKVTVTKFGDRWDLLAYDLLGSAGRVAELMAANPHLISLSEDTLPEGVEIIIPEITAEEETITKVKAPWR